MKNLYFFIITCLCSVVYAQTPADLLESFTDSGLPANYYYYKNNVGNGSLPKVAVQLDGKILINSGNGLERISNNVKDLSFNTGTGFETLPYYSWNYPFSINILAVQPDGKILIGGENFTHYNGTAVNKLIRLNSDGTLDTSFNVSSVSDFVIQPNGKIVVLGYSNLTSAVMFRFESDGTLDTTFNTSETNYASNIELQADGKLLISKYSPNSSLIKRFNSDGSPDLTFNIGTGFASVNRIDAVTTQSDGKILLGGDFTTYNGTAVEDLIRLNADGTVDSSFSAVPLGVDKIKVISLDNQGKILVGSDWTFRAGGNLIRLDAQGNLDPNFIISSKVNGYCSKSILNGVALQPDGKIIVWQDAECPALTFKYEGIGRLNADGSIDNTFNTGGGFNDMVNVIAIQSDNKILVGGNFNNFKGETFNYILRLNPDHSIDRSFNTGSGFNSYVKTIVVQPDGKILVGGKFFYYNGFFVRYLIRLNQDGSIDPSLVAPVDPNSQVERGPDGEVRAITLQPDGKILIGGAFTEYYDAANVRKVNRNLMRLNANNTVDTSFNIGVYGFDAPVNAIALEPSGKIYVGGEFQRVSCCGYYYNSSNYIATLNSNGTIFSTSTYLESPVNSIVPDVNGSMLVGTDSGLIRFTGSGYKPTITGAIKTITLQPDGKILIGGNMTAYNGLKLNNRLARLNKDASLDVDFNCTNLFNATVYAIKVQSDGKIITGGDFTESKGEATKKIAILRGDRFYSISGSNKFDFNNNGCDINDIKFPFLKFNISNGTIQMPNSLGSYSFSLGAGNYTITPFFENPNYFITTPSSITVNFPTQASPAIQDFCITPNGNHPDLEVVLIPIGPARPGFDAKYKLVYKNKGNQLQSGSVSLNFNDETLDYISAVPVASISETNIRTWNYDNLYPFETREILVTLNLNSPVETPPLNGGTILNYTANITSTQADEIPNDNTFVFNQTVVNSFDPNDKTCLEGLVVGAEKIGEYVHYMIRFENTGTYAAQNIIVRDLIDTNKFDVSTLVPLSASALFTTKISEGNKVEFIFQNINLPFAAGTNTGYVAFKIKTKSTLDSGDTFGGFAGIYFDYNSAITTNTFTTTIQALSVTDFSFSKYFSLYPNPVSDVLNINKKESIEISSIHIYNMLGQLMIVIPNAKNMATIDVSNLSSGNYFVKVNSYKGTSNTKFIKK